ncbi:hypothetical protein [Amycolatopsis sp. NPDC004079]|uniref:hypothetical protein n=1 Tax=Amycolatopsis sp. NPDC004079 TaxID=3154549 RepID=UPI0033A709CC
MLDLVPDASRQTTLARLISDAGWGTQRRIERADRKCGDGGAVRVVRLPPFAWREVTQGGPCL